jgi:hypothetical protein
MAQTSLLPYGPKQLNTYSPGTGVYVIYHPTAAEGFIIGAFPDPSSDARRGMADMIAQGSHVGLKIDGVNSFAFQLAHNGNIGDYSATRPLDSVGAEWGAMTETGLGFFLDPFMAYMRVDEATGLFLFYHDQLTRLAGYNLQVQTAGNDREDLDDQSEFSSWEGWSPYTWEAKGKVSPGSYGYREYTATEAQVDEAYYSRYEPYVDDQQAFHRLMKFHGYLGQAESEFLALPPDIVGPYRYTSNTPLSFVFERHLAQSGRYTLRSMKGVTIGKTSLIAGPKQIRRPEDPNGDNPNNYKFNSTTGSGRAHVITGDIALETGSTAAHGGLIRAAAVFDQLSYQYNWEGLHPFHYHRYDWYTPEETATEAYTEAANMLPDFTSLTSNQYLALPPVTAMTVDHRYGASNYYASESFLHFADDGSIVLADGYGFSLVTSQGSAFLSLPGDLWLMPGKNLNVWAGYDTIIKSMNSVDITASQNDVRVAANYNVMVCSGLGGCGGTLIESRADYTSFDFTSKIGEDAVLTGVVLKAKASPIVAAGKHVLVTTNMQKYAGEMHGVETAPDSAYGEFSGGPVVIDAGQGNLIEYGKTVHRHIGGSAIDVFYQAEEYVANEYWFDRASINTPLDVNGRVAINGCLMASGDLQTAGVVASPEETIYVLSDDTAITAEATAIATRLTELQTYADDAKQEGRDLIEGTADIRMVEFSFRKTSQYKTSGLVLYESRWHQMARLSAQTLVMYPWVEISSEQVQKTAPDDETFPFPGREAWTGYGSTNAYRQQDLQLIDLSTNEKAFRGNAASANLYEAAEIPAATPAILAEEYPMLFESGV